MPSQLRVTLPIHIIRYDCAPVLIWR